MVDFFCESFRKQEEMMKFWLGQNWGMTASSWSLLHFECLSSLLCFVFLIVVAFLSCSISLVFSRFWWLLLFDLVSFYLNSIPSQFVVNANERRSNINDNEVDPTQAFFFIYFIHLC